MPKVSVVIPVFKVEAYIEKCVRSLFGQTLDDLEYIFVDDCSPDNSIAVMQKVLEDYPHRKEQVRIIRHEVNQGVGVARNHGIAACTGDYIIHCDPDDWVDLTIYETLYEQAVENNADMVYCNFCVCSETGTIPKLRSGSCDPKTLIEDLLGGISHGALWNKLFRKEIVSDPAVYCPEHIIMWEDFLRVTQMVESCKKIIFVDKPLYYYWMAPDSATHCWNRKKTDDIIFVADFHIERFSGKVSGEAIRKFKLFMLEQIVIRPKICCYAEFRKYAEAVTFMSLLRLIFRRKTIFFVILAKLCYPLGCKSFELCRNIKAVLKKLSSKIKS